MPNPTMKEIEEGTPEQTPIKPGDGDQKPVDLNTEKEKQQTQELTEEQKAEARLAELQAKPADQLTAEEKEELAKLSGEEEQQEESEEQGSEEEGLAFWKDVDALRGEEIKIDWSKHTDPTTGKPVNPGSPAGALIREQYIAKDAVDKFDQHLQKSNPRAYAYFLHIQAGGNDEDFFSRKTITLPEYETFKESVDLQQKVYTEHLRLSGMAEKQIKLVVDQAVKDKEIFELADAAYKNREQAQKKELDQIAAKLQKEQDDYDRSVAEITQQLTAEISSNASMNFLVPETKKAEFAQFVRDRVQYLDGKFFTVQELNSKTMPRLLESLYLQYVNGDIKGLVQRTAQTHNVRRLRKAVEQSAKPPKSADVSTPNKNVPISEM